MTNDDLPDADADAYTRNDMLVDLRDALTGMFEANATTDEIEEWADAYAFNRRDLIDLLRLNFHEQRATTDDTAR